MAIDFNASPYFDDFNEENQFYKILFKPGFAVQGRELNQIQSILQNQVSKMGDHVFKHGSVVIPGNSYADLNTPFVKITSITDADDTILDFESKIIEGSESGVKAIVKKAIAAEGSDPITFYLSYISGSSSGEVTFKAGETLFVVDDPSIEAIAESSDHIGFGSLVSVNNGVYYVNGYFATVVKQTIILSKYSDTPSGHVVLKIGESIIDSEEDESLLDPALGSSNYFASGADRFKIDLTLQVLEIDSVIGDDYIELMRYRDGELEEHSRYPKYSELEKTLARRTFDESGNYVVDGFTPELREHLKVDQNNGVYDLPNGNIDRLVVQVSSGTAYINGFEVEKISRTRIDIDKGRTADHIKEKDIIIRPDYGQYILVSDVTGIFSIKERQTLTLYNDNDPTNNAAISIGTAKIMGADYVSTLSVAANIYKLWLSEVNVTGGYSIEDAGGIQYGANGFAYVMTEYNAPVSLGSFAQDELISHSSGRTANVKYYDANKGILYCYKDNHANSTPRIGDLVTGSVTGTESYLVGKKILNSAQQNSLIFELPIDYANSLKNESLQYELEYTVQKELTIVTDGSGTGSVVVTSGVIDPIEDGTFTAFIDTGTVPINLFDLNLSGDTLSFDSASYPNETIRIFANVTKTNVSPKTKTLTQTNEVFVSPGSIVTLAKYDIVELVSVVDSIGDITQNYDMFNGQSDYIYNRGTIRLKSNKPAPVGNITVTYKYYEHSISGDFFCVDSYSSVSGYLGLDNEYESKSSNKVYKLSNCIDFRPSVGTDGTMLGTGARANDLIVQDTVLRTNLKYFIPRIDSLTLDVRSNLSVIRGIPSEDPKIPTVPSDKLELSRFFIPPYTRTAVEVKIWNLDHRRYTMNDINRLERRTKQIEDYILLTGDEEKLKNLSIIDADTGLDRFKTGFLIEDFSNPLIRAFTTHPDYSSSIINGVLSPKIESVNVPMTITSTPDTYMINNNFITLPYSEEEIMGQKMSSRLLNVNPFLIIKWDGNLNVEPAEDISVEMRDLPILYETKVEEVVVNDFPPAPTQGNWLPVQLTPRNVNSDWTNVGGVMNSNAFHRLTPAGIINFIPGLSMQLKYREGSSGENELIINTSFKNEVNGIQYYHTAGNGLIYGTATRDTRIAMEALNTNTRLLVNWQNGVGKTNNSLIGSTRIIG